MWRVPTPDAPVYIRFNNFWRLTTGPEASSTDSTAFQMSQTYMIDNGALAPA